MNDIPASWESDRNLFIDTYCKEIRNYNTLVSRSDIEKAFNIMYSFAEESKVKDAVDYLNNNIVIARIFDCVFWAIFDNYSNKDVIESNNLNFQKIMLSLINIEMRRPHSNAFSNNDRIYQAGIEMIFKNPKILLTYLSTFELEPRLFKTFSALFTYTQYSEEELTNLKSLLFPILEQDEALFYKKYQVVLNLTGQVGEDFITFQQRNLREYRWGVGFEGWTTMNNNIQTDSRYFTTLSFLIQHYDCPEIERFISKFQKAIPNYLNLPFEYIKCNVSILSNPQKSDSFTAILQFIKAWSEKNAANEEILTSLRLLTYSSEGYKNQKIIYEIINNLVENTVFIDSSSRLWNKLIANSVLKFANESPIESLKKVKRMLCSLLNIQDYKDEKEKDFMVDPKSEKRGINPVVLMNYNNLLQEANIPYQFIEIKEKCMSYPYMYYSMENSRFRFQFEAIVLVDDIVYEMYKDKFIDYKSLIEYCRINKININADEFVDINKFARFNSAGYNEEIKPFISPNIQKKAIPKTCFVVHKKGFFYNDDVFSADVENGKVVSISDTLEEAKKIKQACDIKSFKKIDYDYVSDYLFANNYDLEKLTDFCLKHFETTEITDFSLINTDELITELLNVIDFSFHSIVKYEHEIDTLDFDTVSQDNECSEL